MLDWLNPSEEDFVYRYALAIRECLLRANAYHEGGHAIVAWALRLYVHEITIRDDRPGENTITGGTKHLPLVDQVANCNAGRQAEEVFEHLLPSWASDGDRVDTFNLLAAHWESLRHKMQLEKAYFQKMPGIERSALPRARSKARRDSGASGQNSAGAPQHIDQSHDMPTRGASLLSSVV
jgi:hypothetical protein